MMLRSFSHIEALIKVPTDPISKERKKENSDKSTEARRMLIN
jgi:hypothetical protein